MLKVKGADIYIALLTRKLKQQQFVIQRAVLTSISILALKDAIWWQQIWRFSLEFTDQININNNSQAKQQVPAHSKILPTQIGRVDGLKNTD